MITHIGPHAIDNKGHVKVRKICGCRFQYFIPQLAQDGQAALTVFRDGQPIEVHAPVRKRAGDAAP